jgi:MFS family permease
MAGSGSVPSSWAPLRIRLFRTLWIAALAGNVGDWMQTVGAQWLLVHGPHAAVLVPLVQTADALPAVLFALVGGVLADIFDRVRLLVAVLAGMTAAGGALTALTAAGRMPAALLLMFTFVLGTGGILAGPAYQSLIPDMVPRPQVPAASALGSISINLARAIGPAIAGLLIARTGVAAVFGLNTATFAIYAIVVAAHPRLGGTRPSPERFIPGLRAGSRYVLHAPIVARILLRTALFLVPASALWALLPLIATRRLGLGVPTGTACCWAPWGSAPSAAHTSCRRSGPGCRPTPWRPWRA